MRKLQLNRDTLLPLLDHEARLVAAGDADPGLVHKVPMPSQAGLGCLLSYDRTCGCTMGCPPRD